MSEQPPFTEREFDALAELALDMRLSWNHATDQVWRYLDLAPVARLWLPLTGPQTASSAHHCRRGAPGGQALSGPDSTLDSIRGSQKWAAYYVITCSFGTTKPHSRCLVRRKKCFQQMYKRNVNSPQCSVFNTLHWV